MLVEFTIPKKNRFSNNLLMIGEQQSFLRIVRAAVSDDLISFNLHRIIELKSLAIGASPKLIQANHLEDAVVIVAEFQLTRDFHPTECEQFYKIVGAFAGRLGTISFSVKQ